MKLLMMLVCNGNCDPFPPFQKAEGQFPRHVPLFRRRWLAVQADWPQRLTQARIFSVPQ